jgi:hypothetical protein
LNKDTQCHGIREHSSIDLKTLLEGFLNQHHDILLMGDFNEDLETNSDGLRSATVGLIDLMQVKIGHHNFLTHIDRQTRIDFIFAMPRVVEECIHAGYEPFSKAFGTTPSYAADDVTPTTSAVGTRRSGEKSSTTTTTKAASNIESLDTDSVLKFLGHLGVSQYEVNKRIGDKLQKQLEDELRKTTSQGPLLHLLSSCWPYAMANPEFRPILWAVLKQTRQSNSFTGTECSSRKRSIHGAIETC